MTMLRCFPAPLTQSCVAGLKFVELCHSFTLIRRPMRSMLTSSVVLQQIGSCTITLNFFSSKNQRRGLKITTNPRGKCLLDDSTEGGGGAAHHIKSARHARHQTNLQRTEDLLLFRLADSVRSQHCCAATQNSLLFLLAKMVGGGGVRPALHPSPARTPAPRLRMPRTRPP